MCDQPEINIVISFQVLGSQPFWLKLCPAGLVLAIRAGRCAGTRNRMAHSPLVIGTGAGKWHFGANGTGRQDPTFFFSSLVFLGCSRFFLYFFVGFLRIFLFVCFFFRGFS